MDSKRECWCLALDLVHRLLAAAGNGINDADDEHQADPYNMYGSVQSYGSVEKKKARFT